MSENKPRFNKEDILGIEAKNITYVRHQGGATKDLLVVKEVLHLKNSDYRPSRLKFYENYKRPFWVTSPGRRKHKQKKESEYLTNLERYESTQIELTSNIVKALDDYSMGPSPSLRKISRSPYLYGTDANSSTYLRNEYQKRGRDLVSPNTVASTDIETDVTDPNQRIIMQSISFKEKMFLGVLREWYEGIDNHHDKIRACAKQHIGDVMEARNIELVIEDFDTPAQIVKACIDKAHEWKPDFLTAWNAKFEWARWKEALDREGFSFAEVFSDPSIPPQYKYFRHNEGESVKTSVSGKSTKKDTQDIWDWVVHPASFQLVDSMPIYSILRVGAGKESSYSLDSILEKELELNKLHFEETDKYVPGSFRWHQIMQERYRIEYTVYNLFDTISLELLDEKTLDLAMRITMASGVSDFSILHSSPRQLCDTYGFRYLEDTNPSERRAMASSSDQLRTPLDDFVITPRQLIVTLPAYLLAPTGIKCVKEADDMRSLVYIHVAD